ncbi:immunity 49 family protein [Streptomyces sp. NBC_00091]|uniref:immunity 49 family protein n=1 Tax=Streptomyces sp. NBC_00091 TaxID=2975648 RepID=UPI00225906C5|nr:immunity 49 family protein [Streptomyces sp. NBC_00091]MCX5377633.1 immunity 49 family protein [Streptomyces sp. NBC_00091]
MTVIVDGHFGPCPESADWVRRQDERLAANIEELAALPAELDRVWEQADLHVQSRTLVDPTAAELTTWETVVDAAQLGSALFRTAGMADGTTQCRIHHELRTLPATGPNHAARAAAWVRAFWYAIITRDQPRMTELCELPLDVLRASGADHDDYLFHWVAALQAYWLKRPELVEELTATFGRSHPDVTVIAGREYVQHVAYPPINLFYKFLRKDEEGFHAALVEALELHKRYWTATPERAEDIEGLVPLGILAVACLAYDGGIPVGVESPYLPGHLLKRSWVGEFEG